MIEREASTIKQYLQIFFRRKAIFFISLCIVPLIVFNVSNFLPKRYAANTLIKINDEKLLNPMLSDLAVSSSVQQRLRSIEEEILTWENLSFILSGLSIVKNVRSPVEYERLILEMRRNIDLKMVSQDLIRITYVGKDPKEVKTVVDRISDLFIRKNLNTQNKEADVATKFITEQLKVYQAKLDESERIVALYRLSKDLEKAKQERLTLQKQLKRQPEEIVSIKQQQENPLVSEFRANLIKLDLELAELAVDSTENHPRVIELRQEKAKIESELNDAINSPQYIETKTPNPIYAELDQKLKDTNSKIKKMQKEINSIRALNKDYEPRILPEQELASLARDNRVNEHIYETLLARLETANITQRLEDSKSKTTFEVIEKARLPLSAISLDIMQIISYGLLLGIAVGFGLIVLVEYLDGSFRDITDAKEFLKKPIVGAISTILNVSEIRKRSLQSKFLVLTVVIIAFSLASLGAYFYVR